MLFVKQSVVSGRTLFGSARQPESADEQSDSLQLAMMIV